MTLCANGHEVPDRQQYCGRCGTRAGSDGASNPSATPPGEQPSSASRLLAWSSAHASDLWLVAGVLLVVAFVAIAALSHRGTSRSDSASTSDATTGTAAPAPTEEQPFDRCFDDLNAVIADAQIAPDPFAAAYARWGNQDPRFEFLLTTYAEMQTNLVRVGEQVAYDTVIERVTDYCLQHAIEDGY